MKGIAEKLSPSLEDYLEAIGALQNEKNVTRVKEIAERLTVKSPSVNFALNTLSGKGLVVHEKYGYVNLTAKGKKLAQEVQGKHDTLLNFLTKILNIEEEVAVQDACRMEHVISPQTFNKLTKFIQFVDIGVDGHDPEWVKGFKHYLKTGKRVKCEMRRLAEKKK